MPDNGLADTRPILVTGATGYVGGRLVPRLLLGGYRVRCLVRDPARLAGRGWAGVEAVGGDALKPQTLRAAMQGVSAAYYLIHAMAEGERFEERDKVAALNFGEAARESGVERIIYLGGLARAHQALSPHLRSRHEVGEALRQGGVPVTEFRASIIVGSGSLSFELIRYLTERLPIMICPKWVTTRCQPIAVRNVLEYLAGCLTKPETLGRIIEIGGGDVLTYREMMEIYAEVRGLSRRILDVPILSTRLSSFWVGLITPIPSAIAKPLVEGLKNESVCHDDLARRLFDIPLISYREAARLALDRIATNRVETVWTGALSSAPREMPPPVKLHTMEGLVFEKRRAVVKAAPEKVFDVIARIGGQNGWYYANWLWELRGIMDRVAGGVGLRRGRRNPVDLRVGDPLDFWRVESWETPRLICLRAEMRLPGLAWLQFEITPRGEDEVLLGQTAFFEPRGLAGLFYWYSLYPIHRVIFSGLIAEIKRRAEGKMERGSGRAGEGGQRKN